MVSTIRSDVKITKFELGVIKNAVLECTSDGHSKFWIISRDKSNNEKQDFQTPFTAKWGRIGRPPQGSKQYSFQDTMNKMNEKILKKEYRFVSYSKLDDCTLAFEKFIETFGDDEWSFPE